MGTNGEDTREFHAGGCKVEKERAEHIENCVGFGRVLGMNVQDWWMGLRGQIDDRLLEKIKRIDEGPQEDRRNGSKSRNQKPIWDTVFVIHLFDSV